MKRSFTPQERDAFAKAVSAVEGLKRTPQQAEMFEYFAARETPLDERVRAFKLIYMRRS